MNATTPGSPHAAAPCHVQLYEHGVDIVTAIAVVIDCCSICIDIQPVGCNSVQEDRSTRSGRCSQVQHPHRTRKNPRNGDREERKILNAIAGRIVATVIQEGIRLAGVTIPGFMGAEIECAGNGQWGFCVEYHSIDLHVQVDIKETVSPSGRGEWLHIQDTRGVVDLLFQHAQ